ncbi:MAG: FAD-dependent monooxygenase [Methylotenera sp.]|nr:FAD-dependent monooxygenase [Methylotenera sp.]
MTVSTPHVLIAGAGPVGMMSALALGRAGIRVTLLESAAGLNRDLRASTFHPPTLDMLAKYGLTSSLIEQGLVARFTQQRDRTQGVIAEFDLSQLAGLTDHPFRLQCEQWKLTDLILAQLTQLPHVSVEFDSRVESVSQTANSVSVHIRQGDQLQTLHGDYLIGADGAWSAVRTQLGIAFEGYTYPERFLVVSTPFEYADHMPQLSYVNYCSDPHEWCVLLRVPTLWRVLFPTKEDETDEQVLTDESVQTRLQRLLPQSEDYTVVHRTLYKVHQRVAQHFRQGRVFLAGDAAHINNPLGGMGMNGGIHDAMNLCEKLTAVLLQGAHTEVLDLYEKQRRTIAIEYINASTARNKKEIEERDPVLRQKNHDELRTLAADPASSLAYLRKTSMIDALERAKALT